MTDPIIPDDLRQIDPLVELDRLKLVLVSVVRTFVPLLASWLVSLGLDDSSAATAAAALIALVAYTAVRVFEVYVTPKAGVLLGWISQPKYSAAEKV